MLGDIIADDEEPVSIESLYLEELSGLWLRGLGTREVVRAMRVCKAWRDLISITSSLFDTIDLDGAHFDMCRFIGEEEVALFDDRALAGVLSLANYRMVDLRLRNLHRITHHGLQKIQLNRALTTVSINKCYGVTNPFFLVTHLPPSAHHLDPHLSHLSPAPPPTHRPQVPAARVGKLAKFATKGC